MSKSDGNIVSPYEVLEKWYEYLDIRYFFFTTHYRSFFDFTRTSMEAAKTARHNLVRKIGDDITNAQIFIEEPSFAAIEHKLKTDEWKKFWNEISEAICDDLNTSKFIATINGFISNMNDEVRSMLYRLEDNFLKIWLFETIVEKTFDIPAEVIAFADQRIEAKKNKDYTLADELRNKIHGAWREIKDTKDGYEFSKK